LIALKALSKINKLLKIKGKKIIAFPYIEEDKFNIDGKN